MKKTVTVALLYTLVLAAAVPSFAQKGRPANQEPIVETRSDDSKSGVAEEQRPEIDPDVKRIPARQKAGFAGVEAVTDGSGVLVRWTMDFEDANPGFYVYRSDSTEPLNHSMIVGSLAKRGMNRLTGGEYQYFDPIGSEGSVYTVKAFGANGKGVFSSPASARFSTAFEAETGSNSEQLRIASATTNGSVEQARLELDSDLFEVVQANTLAPDPTTHKQVVSQPGAKIGVTKEGMYRVNRAQLPASIFDNTDTTKWRLFMEGNEQAINVGPNGQYIEFYGKGIDTAESDTRMYYLIVGTVAGKRIQAKQVRPLGGNLTAKNFTSISEQRERTSYVDIINNGDTENYWGRVVVLDTSFPIDLTLPGVDSTGATATITLKMQGYNASAHSVVPTINGHALAPATGDGFNAYSKQYSVPVNFLNDGANSLGLVSSGFGDQNLFDSVTFGYPRRFQAAQNKLSFTTPGLRKVNVDGFTTSNVRVFDTTIDGSPVQIANAVVSASGSTFTATVPASRSAVMYGVEDSALLQPASVTTNNASTLSTSGNAADAVIISYSSSDMMAVAQNWATYRRSAAGGAFNVKVIDVADVFDEFNYGVPSAESIKSFLSYANTSWTTKPRYVLLVGDSTMDPRNYEGFGFVNQVPTKLIALFFGDSGSDDYLADFDNDGLSEMAIGRIAVKTGAEATVALNKTTTFETPSQQNLNRGALFAFDQPIGWDFDGMSHLMRNELPGTVPADFVQRASDGSTIPALKTSLNSGKFIVNWAGHGSFGVWGFSNPYLMTLPDIPNLTNTTSPSIFTMLTCLNGYFIRQTGDSFAETLIKSNGGAVAAWASTTETFPDVQQSMGIRFFNKLNSGSITRLGDLIKDAKTVVPGGDDVRLSWALLGDPMLKVR
nr:hypothetical protein [uncultured bacterium]